MSPSRGIQSPQSLPSSPRPLVADLFQASGSRPSKLGAKPITASTFKSTFPPPPISQPSLASATNSMAQPMQPTLTSHGNPSQPLKPNYNISLPPVMSPMATTSPPQPNYSVNPSSLGVLSAPMAPAMGSPPIFASPPTMGSLLAPSKPAQPTWDAGKKASSTDWGDFDPLA